MSDIKQDEPISRFWSKIELVTNIARMLREMPAGRQTLTDVLDKISSVIGFESASLFLINNSTDTLEEAAAIGQKINLLDFLRLGKGFGLAGWVAEQAQPIMIPGRSPETSGVRDHHDSVLVLPLKVEGQVLGVLCLGHHDPKAFDDKRQKVLEIVADQVAISIERIMSQKELEAKNKMLMKAREELEETQKQLIAQEKLKAVVELAASINHEVNNPLSAIIGNAQMLELDVIKMPPEMITRIKAIVDGARRISLITHKLLKIDRLVTESYLNSHSDTMLNIQESAGE